MAHVLAYWDCPNCKTTNVGPDTHCKNCGAPRPKDVKFYIKNEKEYVNISSENKNPDWICSYCGSSNKSYNQQCTSCGNIRKIEEDKDKEQHNYTIEEAKIKENIKNNKQNIVSYDKSLKKTSKIIILPAIIVNLLFIILIMLFFFKIPVKVQVKDQIWERKIYLEKYQQVIEENWEVPENSTLITSFQDIHHYDKIIDHYETKTRNVKVKVGEEKYVSGYKDLGNGYMEEIYSTRPIYEDREETYEEPVYKNVPVYKTKYRYSIYKWLPDEVLLISNNSKNNITWPKSNKLNNTNIYRISNKEEIYYIIIDDNENNNVKIYLDFERWYKINKGEIINAKKSILFNNYSLIN